ncbi:MAG TPA: hypothetical protein PKN99_06765, partial [Cyclobacteriaceae bacterium]|nr:hypothetical protein [Cyclobacteriaceae bacterium]
MRYLLWIIILTLSSCASSRLARQTALDNQALQEIRSDTIVLRLDTTYLEIVEVGPILIDTVVKIVRKDTLTFIGVGDIM